MTGEDPAEHQRGPFASAHAARQLDGGRNSRDPVQAIEHGEHAEPGEREARQRQNQQRHAAQREIPEQQPTVVEAVRKPARTDGAHEIEQPHERKHAGRRHLGHAGIQACRDEMRLHEPGGGEAAHREGGEQHPKQTLPRCLGQRGKRSTDGTGGWSPQACIARGYIVGGLAIPCAIGALPDLDWIIGPEQHESHSGGHAGKDGRQHGQSPAMGLRQPCRCRQEHQLPRGGTGRQQSQH